MMRVISIIYMIMYVVSVGLFILLMLQSGIRLWQWHEVQDMLQAHDMLNDVQRSLIYDNMKEAYIEFSMHLLIFVPSLCLGSPYIMRRVFHTLREAIAN